jgi:hypothetical protein
MLTLHHFGRALATNSISSLKDTFAEERRRKVLTAVFECCYTQPDLCMLTRVELSCQGSCCSYLFFLMIMRQTVLVRSCDIRCKGIAQHTPRIASRTSKLILLYAFLIDEGELGAAFKFRNPGLETDATGRQEPSTINQLEQYLRNPPIQAPSYRKYEMARHISFTTVDAPWHGCRARPLSAPYQGNMADSQHRS